MLPRILMIITRSEWGGAQQIVYSLATALKEHFHITVACGPGGELISRLSSAGIDTVIIPALRRNPHLLYDPFALWQIYRLLKSKAFDIIHAHSTKAGLLGRLAAYRARVPNILFTAHGWPFAGIHNRLYQRSLIFMERVLAKLTTRIICVSDYDRQNAVRCHVAPHEKLVHIYNGLDPRPFLEIDRERSRAALGLKGAQVVTMVSRLAPPKDPFTLLAAGALLCERYPNLRLLLVGGGPWQDRVYVEARRLHLTDRVLLLGIRSDVPEILAASDIFVLSSQWEGAPLGIIEAMMAGLPVIATRVGGIPELVEEGVTGFLIPPRDASALAWALQRLLEDEPLRRRAGEAGRKRALERFTLEHMVSQYKEIYRALTTMKVK